MLNAFWRVAPSVRFRDLAISPAGVFLRASDFNSRTWSAVQARLFFDPFFIRICSPCKGRVLVALSLPKGKARTRAAMRRDEFRVACFLNSASAHLVPETLAITQWPLFGGMRGMIRSNACQMQLRHRPRDQRLPAGRVLIRSLRLPQSP